MSLTPGTRLGPYEVTVQIGLGGMGEVYRATDANLKRVVAIKVLPVAVAADHQRLARFRREAEMLAALNHPNIAQVYGLEEAGGVLALVMELVDGPTLADRIASKPVPVHEALQIARQITEALDVTHAKGIIHRDLKPANIKVTPDGVVKVLDFGLAKHVASDDTLGDVSEAPTTTATLTRVGALMGTVPYMSPEQVRGEPVDKRADIWAFGCVLYEMLTGRSPFLRETAPDTIAAILEEEPQWTTLPASMPPTIRHLLQRCLEKNPRRRLRDIGDARQEFAAGGLDPAIAVAASSPWTASPANAGSARNALVGIVRDFRLWAILSLAALAGIVVVMVVQGHQSQQRQQLRQAADEVFYNLRALDGSLVRLRQHNQLSADVREATYRRDKLADVYDTYIDALGFYKDKSEPEKAVLRMARRFGEADLDAPPDFYRQTMAWVQRWHDTARLSRAIARGRDRGLIRQITSALDQRGLPRELLFIALQESDFDTSRLGPPGRNGIPKGLWQLTPDVARRYGLNLGPRLAVPEFDSFDERHDAIRSTEAATNYLADLYSSKAGASTLLVIAAYNSGEDLVLRKLEDLPNDPRDRNFWNFYRNHWLPDQSRDYAMSVFALAVICAQPEAFDLRLERIW